MKYNEVLAKRPKSEAGGEVLSAGSKVLPAMVIIIVILSGIVFKYVSVTELNQEEINLERTQHPKEYQYQLNITNQTRRDSRNLNFFGDILLYIGLFAVMVSYLDVISRKVTLSELKLLYIMENMQIENKDVEKESESEEPGHHFRIQ